MSKEVKSNSSQQDSFTIKDIGSIFQRIDNQIFDLLKCSSDDFLNLNSEFKKYYKHSKTIADNANEVFKLISHKDNSDMIGKLNELYKELRMFNDCINTRLQKAIEKIHQTHLNLDHLFLPIKNINQDLMTLKFLVVNLRLSISSDRSNVAEDTKSPENFNKVIDELIVFGYNNERQIVKLNNEVISALNELKKIKSLNNSKQESLLNSIHYAIIHFAEKQEETVRQIPDLTSKTEICSNHIADIITNLQYQDIIRQKMEHIQSAHKNILNEIESIKSINDLSGEEYTQLFSHIREISGIQAAMLVKANKEYQTAIETITNKFESIGIELSSISQMCSKLNVIQQDTKEIHLQEIINDLKNSKVSIVEFFEFQDRSNAKIAIIGNVLKSSLVHFAAAKSSYGELKGIASKLLEEYYAIEVPKNIQAILNQIDAVSNDIEKYMARIQVLNEELFKQSDLIGDCTLIHNSESAKEDRAHRASQNLNSIISYLDKISLQAESLINTNQKLSLQISTDIRDSVRKIKYYDFFENTIVEMILDLNQIYKRLKGDSNLVDDENLQKLKKLYTMASEHNIHDTLSGKRTEFEVIDENVISRIKDKESSDDVELF